MFNESMFEFWDIGFWMKTENWYLKINQVSCWLSFSGFPAYSQLAISNIATRGRRKLIGSIPDTLVGTLDFDKSKSGHFSRTKISKWIQIVNDPIIIRSLTVWQLFLFMHPAVPSGPDYTFSGITKPELTC